MTTQRNTINQLKKLNHINELISLHQEQIALIYKIRLCRIVEAAERELERIEKDGGMTRFPEEIIKLAEGKA